MEDSRSKKPLTDSEMEDKCGSITKQLSLGPNKKPYLLPPTSLSSSSSSSSKPPLRPVPLLLKKPNNSSSSLASIEAVTAKNSEQDKKEQRQTPNDESSAHKNYNVVLNDAAADNEDSNLETKNQHEPTIVSGPSDDRKLKRVISNRMSAHRSRMRKLEHVANLERQCVQLKNQVSVLQPQVEAFVNLKNMLMLEQTVLTQRLEALENQRSLKQGEIERNQAEVYKLRELEKRQKETQAQAMMAFENWDTLPNNQQILLNNTNIAPQGFQNIGETSGMEVDGQTMNLNSPAASMNELNAIINPPKLSDNKTSSEFRFYF